MNANENTRSLERSAAGKIVGSDILRTARIDTIASYLIRMSHFQPLEVISSPRRTRRARSREFADLFHRVILVKSVGKLKGIQQAQLLIRPVADKNLPAAFFSVPKKPGIFKKPGFYTPHGKD